MGSGQLLFDLRPDSSRPTRLEVSSKTLRFGRQMRDRTLLGRFGGAEDIANAAAVSRVRRELVCDRHLPRGRWRHEGR